MLSLRSLGGLCELDLIRGFKSFRGLVKSEGDWLLLSLKGLGDLCKLGLICGFKGLWGLVKFEGAYCRC